MKIKSTRERLLASTMIVGAFALAAAGQAVAQNATAPVQTAPSAPGANSGAPAFGPQAGVVPMENANGQPTTVQAVTVTGSRIPQPNIAATSPITAVGSQELKFEGTTDTIQALDQLPQTNGDLGNNPNPLASGEGITTVNLRGLGAQRTLVLQDGKRLMPGDPTVGGEADIDTIPAELIDRIDVVTGGASAVYGSDAIGGVVNFIMQHNFQGVKFDIQGGFDQSGNDNTLIPGLAARRTNAGMEGFPVPSGGVSDGQQYVASLVFGANTPDGKGNVEGFASYRHQDPVSEGSRSYSACDLEQASATTLKCNGSANSNLFFDGNSGLEYSVLGHSFVPYGTGGTTPASIFNSNPYEYLQRADERYQAGFFAHYQVLPQAELYNDFTFTDDRSQENVAPSAAFLGDVVTPGDQFGLTQVPCNNPLLSAQQVNAICTSNGLGPNDNAELEIGRRNVEGGARTDRYEHLAFRDVLGARGDLNDAFHYDAYAQYGYTRYNNEIGGYLSNSRLASALDAVPDGMGGAKCGYSIPGVAIPCVPYNIFQDGGVTPAALNYLTESGEEQGFTQEQVAHFDITGQLGKYGIQSPFSDRGVGINVGSEYRREQLSLDPDLAFQNNDLGGGSGTVLPVNGSFDVYELFGELAVPIASDRPFVKDLSFDGGYRYSNYSSVGQVESYKLSAEYAPVRDIRFRGSFQRAVRAPNVNELFSAATLTQTSAYNDPCAAINANGNIATATLAQCENTGVTAAQYGNGIAKGQTVGGVAGTNGLLSCPAEQCTAQVGGNSQLQAETSDTVSYGGVFTPRWLPNFDFSVDYYDIDVKGAVGTVPLGTALQECEDTANPTYCNLIHRGTSGTLFGTGVGSGYIQGTDVNVGFFKTTGIDFEGNYRYNLAQLGYGDFGRLAFNFDGTYVQHFISEPLPGLGSYDCAGYYGQTCGFNPRFRSKLRATYISPYRFTVSGQWRYIGAQKLDTNQPNPLLNSGTFDSFDAARGSISYFDLSATYTLVDNITLRAGVNNVADIDPPVVTGTVAGSGAPNAFPEYDLLGRTFYFGLTAAF